MIEISPAAASEIKRLQSSRQQSDSQLRISVKQGGCRGLFYALEFDPNHQQGDRLYQFGGISVIIDPQSHPYLEGLKLDYSEDLMGGGFRFHNANATSTCSCGQSFSVAQTLTEPLLF
jgi:iron-sulfur cluster assembly accessory protein